MIDKATATMGEASPPQYEPGSNASQLPLGKTRQSGVESQNAFELAPSASLPHISTSQSQVEQPETVVSTTNSERDWTIVLSELQNELSDLRSKEKRIKFVQSILDKCPSMYKGKGEALMKRYTGETEVLEQRIQRHMEQLSRTHPDPLVRAEWAGKSQAFAQLIEEEKKGDRDHTKKETMLQSIAKGITLLLGTPLLIGGLALVAPGVMMYGLGKLVMELGHCMTLGQFRD